jgi:hypothetical protein
VPPLVDSAVDADPLDVPDCDAGEGDDADDKEDVDTLRGSDPTAFALVLALLLV